MSGVFHKATAGELYLMVIAARAQFEAIRDQVHVQVCIDETRFPPGTSAVVKECAEKLDLLKYLIADSVANEAEQ